MFTTPIRFMLIAGCLGLSASAGLAEANNPANQRSEAKLAKALEGRVAGAPADCIRLGDIRSSQIIDGTAILYDTGTTLYLNRPTSGASWLDDDDVLVTKTHSSQLCSIDVVYLLNRASRTPDGSVGLGKFIPYTKPKQR